MTDMHSHPDEEPLPPITDQNPELVGKWETIDATFTNAATHVALLHTNKIFSYGGSSLDRAEFENPSLPPGEILDLNVDPMTVSPLTREGLDGDLWCGGHTFLQDGKLLFVGGTSFYPPAPDPLYGGHRLAYLFDPENETWERLEDMQEGRWYPTLIRLADNSVLAIAGLQYRDPQAQAQSNLIKIFYDLVANIKKRIVRVHEVYRPATRTWDLMAEERDFALYPRLHLLPDGDVFYSGVFNTHYFVPGRYPSARWDHQAGLWAELGGRHSEKQREEGISVLLALRPPDYKPQVVVAGGGTHNLGRMIMTLLHSIGKDSWANKLTFLTKVQDSVEYIDLSGQNPRWQRIASMHHPRIHANGVLLPDGRVVVVGGMSAYGHDPDSHAEKFPVLHAEIFDPATQTWSLLAPQHKARVYHSTAILLPDGRVISMGSNPASKMIEKSIEIFSPPYLFRGPRPGLRGHPDAITIGEPFSLDVDPAVPVRQVVLMRPEVLTHVTNTDQRLLELFISSQGDQSLEVMGPPSAAHMPEGYCLLFLLSEAGVPSIGEFIRVVEDKNRG